jgi:hypothetical protein
MVQTYCASGEPEIGRFGPPKIVPAAVVLFYGDFGPGVVIGDHAGAVSATDVVVVASRTPKSWSEVTRAGR